METTIHLTFVLIILASFTFSAGTKNIRLFNKFFKPFTKKSLTKSSKKRRGESRRLSSGKTVYSEAKGNPK
jgi:hypothetical protein